MLGRLRRAGLPPIAARSSGRQAVQDLEFVLAVRGQFPGQMIRAVHHALAAAYAALGDKENAAAAAKRAGLAGVPDGTRFEFSGF